MSPRSRVVARVLAVVALVAVLAVVEKAHSEAVRLVTNLPAQHKISKQTPASYGLPFIDAGVQTSDGLKLVGWYIPGTNGATIILVHGYKNDRASLLGPAALFHAHGYNVLLVALRAHDRSDGTLITFGHLELHDLAAWYAFATLQP